MSLLYLKLLLTDISYKLTQFTIIIGRKDNPNLQLPHFNQSKLHLLTTEQFNYDVKPSIVTEMFFDFTRNFSRFVVNYKTN